MITMPILNDRPTIKWTPNKPRQKTIQKRISRFLTNFKAFYLIVDDEEFFIDSGRWIFLKTESGKYNKFIGHANNVLPFISGKRNIPWGSWNEEQIETKPKRKRKR